MMKIGRSIVSLRRIAVKPAVNIAIAVGQPGVRSIAHDIRGIGLASASFPRTSGSPFAFRREFSVITEQLDSLGDSITTAVIVSWAKEPGDAIKEDDVIAVVETDKVTMDIRAKKSGVFVEGLAKAASEITVGAPLYRMDTSATAPAVAHSEATVTKETPAAEPAAASASSGAAAEEIMVPVPVMGESITTGVLANWTVKTGDSVAADQVIGTIDTDKVSVDVRAPQQGTISKVFSAEGDEINVGAPLFAIVPGSGAVSKKSAPAATAATPAAKEAVKPSPATYSAAPAKAAEAKPAAKPATAPAVEPPVKAAAGSRTEKRVKLTRMRQRIAVRLKEAQNTAAMLTTFQEVDMTNLIALRNTHKEEFEKIHGVKLGFMSAFVRATTVSLQEIPAVNAVIDDATQEIVYRNYVDVSVAVASPKGLVVPVLRNTETMSFADIEKAIAFYGKKAKDETLSLEDMTGGTFTISNGGTFGSLFGTPIINPPQSAILGMHATKPRAVVINGKVEARPMMYLALTYDHRLIDGREAVTFLKSVANKIEDPGRLLLTL
jgi:2-oxoglutarate dehydrogenase E2 component (dihydrolipoamide succinyltransferase)